MRLMVMRARGEGGECLRKANNPAPRWSRGQVPPSTLAPLRCSTAAPWRDVPPPPPRAPAAAMNFETKKKNQKDDSYLQ